MLSLSQKSLLLNAGLQLVEYNAITIQHVPFGIPDIPFDALIFTSQNALRSYLRHLKSNPLAQQKTNEAFCVGEKTKSLLQENGFEMVYMANDAKELGKVISGKFSHLHFLWPVGNLRRDELPTLLEKERINFTEVTVYKTETNPKKFNGTFDGILFFSPSGVMSFMAKNTLSDMAFCIGNTTAEAVRKYTDNYIVANKPTVENVLVQAVKRLQVND